VLQPSTDTVHERGKGYFTVCKAHGYSENSLKRKSELIPFRHVGSIGPVKTARDFYQADLQALIETIPTHLSNRDTKFISDFLLPRLSASRRNLLYFKRSLEDSFEGLLGQDVKALLTPKGDASMFERLWRTAAAGALLEEEWLSYARP
jgi:hypothetical protein